MVDFHTHSTASDGTLSPRELMAHAKKTGLVAIALTDHENLDGLDEADLAAKELGLRLIRGIELDITWQRGECHLLGLGLSLNTLPLEEILLELKEKRDARNKRILEYFASIGVEIDYSRVVARAGGDIIGRLHFADELVELGLAKKRQDIFDRYLAKERGLFAEKGGISMERAIAAIHGAGGIAVLAHPHSLYLSRKNLTPQIGKWKGIGLDGVEVWHSGARGGQARYLAELVLDLGLFACAGSDFHGANRPDRKLGHGTGGKKISASLLKDFDRALSARL